MNLTNTSVNDEAVLHTWILDEIVESKETLSFLRTKDFIGVTKRPLLVFAGDETATKVKQTKTEPIEMSFWLLISTGSFKSKCMSFKIVVSKICNVFKAFWTWLKLDSFLVEDF